MPAVPRPVRPLSKLLIATDFSPGAALARTRATLLPLGPRPRVTLLHVLPPVGPAPRPRERAEAKQRLEREAAELREGFRARGRPDVPVRAVLMVGEPVAEILARGRRADLLLLGRHGHRRFRDLLLGSTAERIIRAGHVPVLIATAPARGPYRRPLVAVDLSPPSRRAAETAARVMSPGPPALDIVHVYETAHDRLLHRVAGPRGVAAYTRRCRAEAMEAVTAMLARSAAGPATRELLLRRGDPRTVILSLIAPLRADLVAVGSHGRSPVLGSLVGSVAEGVVRHAPCDALIVPPAPVP